MLPGAVGNRLVETVGTFYGLARTGWSTGYAGYRPHWPTVLPLLDPPLRLAGRFHLA
jgi:hypothetical protein